MIPSLIEPTSARTLRARISEILNRQPRIEAVNPAINAVPVVLGEPAMAAATAAELPPLHGVPFTVKGNIDLAGHNPHSEQPAQVIPTVRDFIPTGTR